MARKAESNGAIETLRRLFGTDQDYKLVSKYARESLLKNHLEASSGIVFKRSSGCDNLIKNLLALDSVFNSQKLVTRMADGEVPATVGTVRISVNVTAHFANNVTGGFTRLRGV